MWDQEVGHTTDQYPAYTRQVSLLGVVTNRMLAIAKSKASVSTIIGRSGVQWQRTGAEVNATFSKQNASHSVEPKDQGVLFLQRLVRGVVSSAYLWMK